MSFVNCNSHQSLDDGGVHKGRMHLPSGERERPGLGIKITTAPKDKSPDTFKQRRELNTKYAEFDVCRRTACTADGAVSAVPGERRPQVGAREHHANVAAK